MRNVYFVKRLWYVYKRIMCMCLLSTLFLCEVFAQEVNVNGRVFDKETGEPLIGVTVMEKPNKFDPFGQKELTLLAKRVKFVWLFQ